MSVPFRDRNPVIIGAVSIAVIAALLLAAFRADSLPLIGGGDTYYAEFTESGGLKANDEVRVAGVRVGKVKSVELDGDKVVAELLITEDVDLGERTGAEIKIRTLLGALYVALVPRGEGELTAGATIPTDRTTPPYDVVDAFEGLAETSEAIDTEQLAGALDTLAELTDNTPEEFREALDGVSRLSANIAARDEQLATLLQNTRNVTGVLADRNQDIVTLMRDGDVLFQALVARRQSISNLLRSTARLSQELTALVRQSRADLKPALQHLDNVVDVLNRNQANLDNSLRLMAPFYRVFANTLGTGPWFDTYIQNLLYPIPDFSDGIPELPGILNGIGGRRDQ
ncbi:MCE family protein [Nocardioides massiliensis]|uniref:Phospholipid/cholesterol/gamma-HCH transport system substrate-binding protein n=1 Tax=Nocardioides massiliensis TaxID=1325935 RepID=A0ABT9NNV1_9ACTN|nr:MCE family protein [Nocardioides massiliensis]MDP9821986.1 phospholipid/cholesterol/gamma-HCH transport system substrate-binding protein [Nocardioides massiliensis]